MKKAGIIIFGSLIISLFAYLSTSRGEVQVVRVDNKVDYGASFLSDVSQVKNNKGLELSIGKDSYSSLENKGYVSDHLRIMLPLQFITEELDCSVIRYKDGHILISKGDNLLTLTQGSSVAKVNEKVMKLGDEVVALENEIYVPIDYISEYLGYSFDYALSKGSLALNPLSDSYVLPIKYDMRDLEAVTPVRDQGKYGTCWAFASLAAMESTLMPLEEYSFSPDHMSLGNDFHLTVDEGGEFTMAIAYLASWKGPVLEKDDPYGDSKTDDSLKAVKHLEDAYIIGEKDYEGIKGAVYKYGGVETSIYTQLVDANSWSSYYNKDRSSYYFNGEKEPNHDVVIVGWDDNFPKEYFTTEPEGDGAFICKNSWGEDFGEGGYFYVSYYDTIIGTVNVVYAKVGNSDNYDHIYQSDLLGWTGQLGYNSEDAYFANVYRAKSDEDLEAVGFYATGDNTKYVVYVVEDYNNTYDLENKVKVAQGNAEYSGYYTVEFNEAIALSKNQKYAIVVYVETPGSIHPVAIEYAADEKTKDVDITDGEGFISLYGEVWMDTEKEQNCNLCLKAFTNDQE